MSHGDWKQMFKAVQDNDPELLEFYIRQGIDLNYQHPEYFTSALIESIRLQHHNITKMLLENGAMPDLADLYSGKTPLQIATDVNNQVAVGLLKGNERQD